MATCTHESHDVMRRSWAAFDDGTAGRTFEVEGVLYKNCISCHSTIGIPCCALCGMGCDAEDRLPWRSRAGAELVAHFGCVTRRMLAKGAAKFVILAGGGAARDLVLVRSQLKEVSRGR